jgi:hypothetical protein
MDVGALGSSSLDRLPVHGRGESGAAARADWQESRANAVPARGRRRRTEFPRMSGRDEPRPRNVENFNCTGEVIPSRRHPQVFAGTVDVAASHGCAPPEVRNSAPWKRLRRRHPHFARSFGASATPVLQTGSAVLAATITGFSGGAASAGGSGTDVGVVGGRSAT